MKDTEHAAIDIYPDFDLDDPEFPEAIDEQAFSSGCYPACPKK